ncbi:MAG: PfkB family carbohydrate kinase [Anaerovoracaceae bacterium]
MPGNSSEKKEILVIGSTVADIIINVNVLPTTAQDIHVKSQTTSLGGCAYNVSAMIDLFGVPYTLFSPVGKGMYGDFVRKELDARGIISPVPTPDNENGCCYCFVEESGERTFISYHGAEYLFEKEWFDVLNPDRFSYAYICGLEIEDKTGDVIVDFLEKSKIKPVFAPGPRIDKIDKNLMERIFALHPIVHLNEDEVTRYTETADIESASMALFDMTGETVIVTTGEKGSCYYDGKDFVSVAAVKPGRIVDTIGAGDGHCGAVLACLSKDLRLDEALAKANEAASRIVSVKGAVLSSRQ